MSLKNTILNALIQHAEGHIAKHEANVMIFLERPVADGNIGDILSSVETELDEIIRYQDHIKLLTTRFMDSREPNQTISIA